jgi:hypothetical protein
MRKQNLALNALPEAVALVYISWMIHLPHPHITVAASNG